MDILLEKYLHLFFVFFFKLGVLFNADVKFLHRSEGRDGPVGLWIQEAGSLGA